MIDALIYNKRPFVSGSRTRSLWRSSTATIYGTKDRKRLPQMQPQIRQKANAFPGVRTFAVSSLPKTLRDALLEFPDGVLAMIAGGGHELSLRIRVFSALLD